MNGLVCFKVVRDLDMVLDRDWQIAPGEEPDVSYAASMYGCFDESALELALRIKDRAPDTRLTAVTVGGPNSLCTALYALGFAEVVCIEAPENLDFDPLTTAELLADFLRNKRFDWILAGQQSNPGDNGQVPLLLAEALGLPCVSQITAFSVQDGIFIVEKEEDTETVRFGVRGPAVFTVGNVSDGYLRMATLKEKLAVKGRQVDVLIPGEMTNASVEVTARYRETAAGRCEMLGGTLEEQAAAVHTVLRGLLEGGRAE